MIKIEIINENLVEFWDDAYYNYISWEELFRILREKKRKASEKYKDFKKC